MNDKLISIIVPIYNAELYLEYCLDSLVNQTYNNLEIICINDGSTDKSGEIIEKYAKLDQRIKVFNILNSGVSIARNLAIDNSNGEYIMFVDGDDWIDLDTCEIALNIIIGSKSDVVMWSYKKEYGNKKSIKKEIFNQDTIFSTDEEIKALHRRFIGPVGKELKKIESADSLSTVWGKLYSKESIDDNRFIDIKEIGTYEDGLFNLHVFQNIKKATFTCKIYHHYRKHNQESITYGYKPNLIHNWFNLFNIMNTYIQDNISFEDKEYFEALNNRIALSVIGLGLNEHVKNVSKKNKLKALKRILNDKLISDSLSKFSSTDLRFIWNYFFRQVKKKKYFLVSIMLDYMVIKVRKSK